MSPTVRAGLGREVGEPWSQTSRRDKLIKIGAKVVNHGRLCELPEGRDRSRQRRFGVAPSGRQRDSELRTAGIWRTSVETFIPTRPVNIEVKSIGNRAAANA